MKIYERFKQVLQIPEMFIPPVFEKIIDIIKWKMIGVEYPFHYCINDRNRVKAVFDIGANIGDITLAASRSFPNAQIYSFEPVSGTYEKLCENVRDYDERINAYNFGFFNIAKKLDINITSFHGANSIIEQSQSHKNIHPNISEVGSENIEVKTMDSFVSEENIEKIDIVKIDVEGVEKEVIEGGKETFKNKVDYVFVELSFLRRDKEPAYWVEICQLLYGWGFTLMNIYDVARYTKNGRNQIAQIDAIFMKNT